MGVESKRIAIFEDDQDLIAIFHFLFEDAGAQVVSFQDCNDVIEKVNMLQPDLILMDNWIPDTGGEVAVRLLKADPDLQHIPVIYISANNDVREIADRAGADRFMAKPFEFDDLLALAAELTSRRD